MGLLGDILLALLCGGKSGKGRTAGQDEDWLEECEECGEHYDDCNATTAVMKTAKIGNEKLKSS